MTFRFRIKAFTSVVLVGTSMGCTELPPPDSSGPLVMTVWMRQLIDRFNHPVPFGANHIPTANRVWYLECFVGIHARRLPSPIDVRGVEDYRFIDGFPLGEQFWDDDVGVNRVRIQNRRINARHVNEYAQPVHGYIGTNLFSTKKVVLRNGVQTAKGLTERGANASVLIAQDDEPKLALTAAHELGHQLNLRDRPVLTGQDTGKWVMHGDVFSGGPHLSGWEYPHHPAPDPGSECEVARAYGTQKFYLLRTAIITDPLP